MPWVSTAVSVGGSLLGGMMGGSKGAERDAKDAAARANQQLQESARNAKADAKPFIDTGTAANQLLAQYLGIDTSGYAPKPTREQAAAQVRDAHFKKYGKDYARNSNMGWVEQETDRIYQKSLADWESGLEKWKQENPDGQGDGRLLKNFTNEDFVRDPGYEFRMGEGNKGIDRAFASRGGTNSGAALKAIARFNQDYASNEFGAAYNRDATDKNRIYSFLSGTANTGLGAAQNNASMSFNAANQAGQNAINAQNTATMLSMNRQNNQQNAVQSAIGNYIYGTERAKDRSVLGGSSSYGGQTNAYPGAYYA
jgi:hypothetical protein